MASNGGEINASAAVDHYASGRRRESKACDSCRRRKTKCNSTRSGQCSSCLVAGLVCNFSGKRLSQQDPLSRKIQELQSTLEVITERMTRAEAELVTSGLRSSNSPGTVPECHPSPQSHTTQHESASSQADVMTVQDEDPSATIVPIKKMKRSSSTGSSPRSQIQLSNDGSSTHHFFGPTSGMVFISNVAGYVELLGFEVPSSNTLCRSSILDSTGSTGKPLEQQQPVSTDLRSLLPPQALGERLLMVYAQHVQAYTPMLYWPSINARFRRAYARPIYQDDAKSVLGEFCVLNMIWAVGSQMSNIVEVGHSGGQQRKNGWDFFELAMKFHNLIKPAYTFDDGIVTLLMSVYLLGASLQSPSWVVSGIMCRIAQDLGLHKRPPMYQFSNVELESRSRLFWGTYLVDRKIAFAFGRSVIFSEDTYDVALPGEADEGGSTSLESLSMFRIAVNVASHLDEIIQLECLPGQESADLATLRGIDAKLTESWHKYPARFVDERSSEEFEPSVLKLTFLLQHARMALFRHFTDARLDPGFKKFCLTTSVNIAVRTAKTLLRVAHRHHWEHDIARQCNDLVYTHIFRAAVVLLLAHGGFPETGSDAIPRDYLAVLTLSLKAASTAHSSATKFLNLLRIFASTFECDLNLICQNSKLSDMDSYLNGTQDKQAEVRGSQPAQQPAAKDGPNSNLEQAPRRPFSSSELQKSPILSSSIEPRGSVVDVAMVESSDKESSASWSWENDASFNNVNWEVLKSFMELDTEFGAVLAGNRSISTTLDEAGNQDEFSRFFY